MDLFTDLEMRWCTPSIFYILMLCATDWEPRLLVQGSILSGVSTFHRELEFAMFVNFLIRICVLKESWIQKEKQYKYAHAGRFY